VKRGEVDVQDATKLLAVIKELKDAGLEREQSFEHQRVSKELAGVKQVKADAVMAEIREGPTYDLIRQFELEVELEVGRLPGSTIVPRNAIHRQADEAFVWRLIDGTHRRTTVQLGPRDATHVVVTSGLAAGDRVLLRNE